MRNIYFHGFILLVVYYLNPKALFARGGGIDPAFGVNGIQKHICNISYAGGSSAPLNVFTDSLNRDSHAGFNFYIRKLPKV